MSVEFRMIEPFDYSSVISAFDQLPTENTQYVFDTTGGSNFFIAVAGHYAAYLPQENEIRIYDINKQICHSGSEEKSRKITLPKLKVEEVIKIHNSSVIKEPDSLIRHTISDADLKILERLWELASRAPAQWNRFMQSARIMYPSKKINGKNVVKINDTVLNDVVTGVYLDWDTEKNKSNDETTNEIDVIATAGCIPIVISCKNTNIVKEYLYELETVANHYCGKYSRKVIVTSAKALSAVRNRANDMGITVIDNLAETGFKNFQEKLKKLNPII